MTAHAQNEHAAVRRAQTADGYRLSLVFEETDDAAGEAERYCEGQPQHDERSGKGELTRNMLASRSRNDIGPVARLVVERFDERLEEVLHRATSSSSLRSFA